MVYGDFAQTFFESNSIFLVLQTAHLRANTAVYFGVHDRLHVYPLYMGYFTSEIQFATFRNSTYATTKLHSTPACGCNNNECKRRYFHAKTLFLDISHVPGGGGGTINEIICLI